MKVELTSYMMTGEMALELIAESDIEMELLINSWRVMETAKPYRGNGQSVSNRGSTGFYLPVTPRAASRVGSDDTR